MTQIFKRTVLCGAGALLLLIGSALMFSPKAFLETSHVFIDHDPGLMSELSAPSGLLIITGALLILGAVKVRFANLGLSVGAIVYASYGLGRLISMALNGMPSESLVAATVIELGIGALLVMLRVTSSPNRRRDQLSRFDRTLERA